MSMSIISASTHPAILQKGLLMLSCLLLATVAAQAQSVPSSVVRCTSGCGSSSGSGGGSSSNRSSTPTRAEREAQRRQDAAYELNAQGNAAFDRDEYLTALNYYLQALRNTPNSVTIRENLALAQDHLGVEAYNRGDWKNALELFREALKNNPANSNYADYLRQTEQNYQAAELEKEQRRRDAVTAEQMRGTIDKLSSSVTSTPPTSTPGLDFIDSHPKDKTGGLEFDEMRDASTTTAKAAPKSDGLDFTTGDTKVVDSRNVPSGMSKDMDNAIAGAFKDAPPGVVDRVRKGFQAVMNRDWKVAKAWFQDALNRDPNNENLKKLVKLTDYDKTPAIQLPVDSDLEFLFPSPSDNQSKTQPKLPRDPIYILGSGRKPVQVPDDYRGEVQTYALRKDGSFVPLPKPSEMNFLFPEAVTPPPPRQNVPTFRLDKVGNPVELPDDYNGDETAYIKDKDGKLTQVPKPSDGTYLLPVPHRADTPKPASAPKP